MTTMQKILKRHTAIKISPVAFEEPEKNELPDISEYNPYGYPNEDIGDRD